MRSRAGTIAFLRGEVGSGLFAIEADGSGLRRLTPSGLDVASFEWAPDGSRIAYLDSRGALRLVRPDGTGGELLAAGSPLRSPWFLSWSPDGKAIAVVARDPAAEPLTAQNLSHLRIFVSGPTGACRGVSLPAMWNASTGLREGTRSPTGMVRRQRIIRTDGSKARPFFRQPAEATGPWVSDLVAGRNARRVRGRVLDTGVSAPATGMTRSMSQTRTEATFTSSRAMPTTSTGSPGLPTGGAFSTAGRTAKASTSSAPTDRTTTG